MQMNAELGRAGHTSRYLGMMRKSMRNLVNDFGTVGRTRPTPTMKGLEEVLAPAGSGAKRWIHPSHFTFNIS